MQLYANKSFLCSLDVAKEDGLIDTYWGSLPVKKGELLLTDQNSNTFPVTEQKFKDSYVPVKKENTIRASQLSPFEEQMIKGYIEMGKINKEEAEAGSYTYTDGLEDL